jgi:hypothetical protein
MICSPMRRHSHWQLEFLEQSWLGPSTQYSISLVLPQPHRTQLFLSSRRAVDYLLACLGVQLAEGPPPTASKIRPLEKLF